MAFYQLKNNGESTLASGLGDLETDLTLTVASGQGDLFPSTGDFMLTLAAPPPASDSVRREIVRGTARTADAITIVRAQEDTSRIAHLTGDLVELRITAGVLTNIESNVLALADIDDSPVDGVTNAPISSNWAYDHAAATTGIHGVGAGTIAKTADITATKLDDFATPDANTDLNANTTNHGLLLQATAPASTLLNVVGIANGETAYTNKALVDSTAPADISTAVSASGSQVIAARRDHVHGIAAAAVTLAKMADLAQDKIIGRATASTGVPEAIDCTAAGRALLDDANATAQLATLGCGTMALATATDYITFAKATTITAHGACTGWDDPAGTCTVSFTAAWKHSATVDEDVTMVFTDPGVGATLHLILTKDATATARTITYPVSGISWIGTALTSLTTNAGKYVVVLLRTATDTYIAQGSEAI